jgi:hypothetical protein
MLYFIWWFDIILRWVQQLRFGDTCRFHLQNWRKTATAKIESACFSEKLAPTSETIKLKTPWHESASKIYRPRGSRLSAKLVPTFVDRGCHEVSVTDPYGRILGFLDRRCYVFFQVAPQLYSRASVYPVPEPLLLRKSGSAGNRTRTSGSVAWNSAH